MIVVLLLLHNCVTIRKNLPKLRGNFVIFFLCVPLLLFGYGCNIFGP